MSALFDLSGRTAVVTGGSRGIGAMIARGLLDAGCRVLVTARDPQACATATEQLSAYGDVSAVALDLSTEAACLALAEQAGQTFPTLDILVNNAGATWAAPLEEYPMEGWDKVFAINLAAPFLLTRALLPLLEGAATADHPARVINIGSVDGVRVSPRPIYAYSASKAGLHHLTRVLSAELGPRHITVNAIAPGPFETKMTAGALKTLRDEVIARTPLGRLGRPDDMAGAAVFLASRAGSYVTGAVIPVDGGTLVPR